MKNLDQKHHRCGDILITKVTSDHKRTTRHGLTWKQHLECGPWTIYLNETNEYWQGFPYEEKETDRFYIFILGEGQFQHLDSNKELQWEKALQDPAHFNSWNGHSLIFLIDKKRHHLHVISNRLGTLHAYYDLKGTRISSFSGSLMSDMREATVDHLGQASFLSFGFYLGNRTGYSNIKTLTPASFSTFYADDRECSIKKYWTWSYQENTQRSFRDTVEEFATIFERIIQEQCRDTQIAMPLSGGLDSRCAFAVSSHDPDLQQNCWNFSYGYTPDSIEPRIARSLCKARGQTLSTLTIDDYLFDKLKPCLMSNEGFHDITSSRQWSIINHLQHHVDTVMAAHWGDVWLDDMQTQNLNTHNQDELVEFLFKKMAKQGRAWLLKHLIQEHVPDYEDQLKQELYQHVQNYQSIDNLDFKIKALKTDLWSHRWTCASLRSYQPGAYPRLCFYDNRMVDFFSTVPRHMLEQRKLQMAYLTFHHPDLASVKWHAFDTNLYWKKYFHSLLIPKRAFKKINRALFPKKQILRNWEVQFLNEQGQKHLRRHLLNEDLKIHQNIAPHLIEPLINEVYQTPNGANGYSLAMLLTYALWQEYIA